jgi:hypothetical protein
MEVEADEQQARPVADAANVMPFDDEMTLEEAASLVLQLLGPPDDAPKVPECPFVFPTTHLPTVEMRPIPLQPVPEDRDNGMRIQDVTKADVLYCGVPYPTPTRVAWSANRHAGNVAFQALMREHRIEDQESRNSQTKIRSASKIVSLIREIGGRFLRYDRNTEMWFEMGDIRARIGCSMTNRSVLRSEPKSFTKSLRTFAEHLVLSGRVQSTVHNCYLHLLQYLGNSVTCFQDGSCHVLPLAFRFLKDCDEVASFVNYCLERLPLSHLNASANVPYTRRRISCCLLALLLMNLEQKTQQQTFQYKMQCFLETHQGRILEQVSSVLKELTSGSKEYQDSQEARVQAIVASMDTRLSTAIRDPHGTETVYSFRTLQVLREHLHEITRG